MEPVNRLLPISLQPYLYRVGFVVKFNVYHVKYALHSAVYSLVQPPFTYLGPRAQNSPFKAHNDFIVRYSATYLYIIKDNSLVGQSCHLRLPKNWRVLLC